MKCQKCHREATVHLTDIVNGQKIEKHLCQECATAEGLTSQVPFSKLLEDMALQSQAVKEMAEVKCPVCGMTFLEFRQNGLLGCPNDYEAFASTHAGKIPPNADEDQRRQSQLLRLRGQLKQAVAEEDYEQAARLRDGIKELEGS